MLRRDAGWGGRARAAFRSLSSRGALRRGRGHAETQAGPQVTREWRDEEGCVDGGDRGRAHACTVGEEMRGRPRRRVLRIPDWLHEPPLDWTGSQSQARPETARSIAHTITTLVPPQPVTRDANPGSRWSAYGTFDQRSVGSTSIEMAGITHVLTPRVLESGAGQSTSTPPCAPTPRSSHRAVVTSPPAALIVSPYALFVLSCAAEVIHSVLFGEWRSGQLHGHRSTPMYC